MENDLTGYIAIAMSLIGFIAVWIRLGQNKGRQEEIIESLKVTTEEHKRRITEIENKTHGLELRIAEFMGEIRVKIDNIKETLSELKPKGGTRAAKK